LPQNQQAADSVGFVNDDKGCQISGGRLVRILSTDNQRIDLLLIPVETVPANAESALTMATDGHDPEITPLTAAASDHAWAAAGTSIARDRLRSHLSHTGR
jgi:hypothetical protein